ncbi:hypothetical protein MIND_00820100 [Mycena indigotica]|uniref:F-box domain-containing protein n=1 Tax=Mycena indigotica TaxID=2126181 RepID=A0A8H6W0P1_9AGAR|nr:uncharacterized protein MIND_00820100 [Mycena indigotica]KAF7298726.1 hypothetical protein MIND_00820100 [Mycena indigotica]
MSSVFAAWLGTNYCPTEDEVQDIRAFLAESQARVDSLNEAIAKLQEERDKLMEHITAHQVLCAPIRRLPPDVLRELFAQCLPVGRNCAMSAREGPILLGRICSSWRSLVRHTPELWSRLHVVEPPLSTWYGAVSHRIQSAKVQQRLQAIKLWLDRAGSLPLSISFQRDGERGTNSATMTRNNSTLLPFLASYVPRCTSLHLDCPAVLFDELAHIPSEQRVIIEDITLQGGWSIDRTSSWETLRVLESPTLRRLTLAFYECIVQMERLPVNWVHLTFLKIRDPFTSGLGHKAKISKVLSGCFNLRTCVLELCDSDDIGTGLGGTVAIPPSKAVLPHLQHLQLSTDFSLLPHLVLPSLRHLILQREDDGYAPPRDDCLLDNIQHILPTLASSPRLETLRCALKLPDDSLMDLLAALPSTLLTLELVDNPADPQLDDPALEYIAKSGCYPELHTLQLRKCESISEEGIIAFLQLQVTSNLRELHIEYDTGIVPPRRPGADALAQQLQPFRAAGTEIRVTRRRTGMSMVFSPFSGMSHLLTKAEREAFFELGSSGPEEIIDD